MKFKLEQGSVYRLHLDTGERLIGMYIDQALTGSPKFAFRWTTYLTEVSQDRIAQCELISRKKE